MYSLCVLACVYHHDMSSSFSFLAGKPRAGPCCWFSEDVGACLKYYVIWGSSAGRRCRRGEKKIGFGSQKTSLFGEETRQQPLVANRRMLVPPCSNRLLIFHLKIKQAFVGVWLWGYCCEGRKKRASAVFWVRLECHNSKVFDVCYYALTFKCWMWINSIFLYSLIGHISQIYYLWKMYVKCIYKINSPQVIMFNLQTLFLYPMH